MTIKEMPYAEFMASLDPEFREAVTEGLTRIDTPPTWMVLFENQNLSSSHLGEQKIIFVGPGLSTETVEELDGKHLGDVPSVMMYPTTYARIER